MSPTPYLILESQGGGHVPLTEFTNFGRAEDNTVVFNDIGVSTHHAVIRKEGAFWVVEDLGSTNGTWLNRQRVEIPTVIKDGDQLQMGAQRMRVSGFRGSPQPRNFGSEQPNLCPRCYKGLPPQAVFCPSCGLPVAAQPPQQGGWTNSTVPFQVPYPQGRPSAPSRDSNRNALVLGLSIVGGIVLILSILLGWLLREKTLTKSAPKASYSTLPNSLSSPSRMVRGWGGQPGM